MAFSVKRVSANVSDSCSQVSPNATVGIVCFGCRTQSHTAVAGLTFEELPESSSSVWTEASARLCGCLHSGLGSAGRDAAIDKESLAGLQDARRAREVAAQLHPGPSQGIEPYLGLCSTLNKTTISPRRNPLP